jgi:CRP-like cAMP-binding protein
MNPLDAKVLDYLRTVNGCTAWVMSGRVKTTREEVSKACQRLKRKGLIAANGSYWQAVKP